MRTALPIAAVVALLLAALPATAIVYVLPTDESTVRHLYPSGGDDTPPPDQGACTPTTTALQFDGGYKVSMCYRTPQGAVGQARSGIWASGQAGLLWFFDRGNAEVLVKVLDGCSHNGHRWVYVAPVTDLEFNLWVTGPGGRRWTHSNRQGTTASAKSDNRAFSCADEGDGDGDDDGGGGGDGDGGGDDGGDGSPPRPPRLSDRESLIALYNATDGPNWRDSTNWLTDAPLGEWYGVETDADGRVVGIHLGDRLDHAGNRIRAMNLAGGIPPELGNLTKLQTLNLNNCGLLTGPIPPELGNLANLLYLDLSWNPLLEGSVPPELGNLESLRQLRLIHTNLGGPLPPELGKLSRLEMLNATGCRFTGPIPPEFGNLQRLEWLSFASNYLEGSIPRELGNLSSLSFLSLSYNEYLSGEIPEALGDLGSLVRLLLDRNLLTGPIPAALGNLGSLSTLALYGNNLTGPIPAALGNLESLNELELHDNDLTGPIPAALGRLTVLEKLLVHNNELSGRLPAEIAALQQLQDLWVGNNPELSGALPATMPRLARLESLKAGGTGLCAPDDEWFLEWLAGVSFHRVARCRPAEAYITQTVQSRTDPVPLIAWEPGLLRAFVASPDAEGEALPPARVTFYLNGSPASAVETKPGSGTIPGTIEQSEGSLERSINVEVPGGLVQPGLEFVVEVDPGGVPGAARGVTGRIPATGRMAVDVVALQDLRLTVVPFLHETEPDSSILAITEGMAAAPATHPMLEHVRVLLPVADIDLELHDPVTTSDNVGFQILSQTEMIRQIEGRPGYLLGMQSPVRRGLLGVALGIPSWSVFSQPLASTIAHELGHAMGLWHAPCGGAGGPDPLYPHPAGLTDSWGYDRANKRLVSPWSPDLMTYCGGKWIGDYHRANALRHRMKTESAAAFPARVRSLVAWGGLDADGRPYLEPAFLTDAMPTLPPAGADFMLRAITEDGTEAFDLRFSMPATQDAEGERRSFVFSLPVTWAGALESITLSGRNGVATLSQDTDEPFTILKDRATGQVAAFLRGRRPTAAAAALTTSGTAAATDYEVLFSTGIPESN